MAKARLRRGIEMVKLANRIENLKMQEEDEEHNAGQQSDIPSAEQATGSSAAAASGKAKLSNAAKSAIFREVVLAKVRENKAEEEKTKVASGVVKPS